MTDDLSTLNKRAVIYLRVSTGRQADNDYDNDGLSIPAQRDACLRKALAMDAAVVDEYVDRGESARSADRPALQLMLERLQTEHDIDYVIVHKVDRLARNRADDIGINVTIRKAGAKLVSVNENIDDTPSGRFLHGIMADMAEFYSANLSQEIRKGLDQKAKVGGTNSKAPLGYLNVRDMTNGREIRTIAVDPERAPLITKAFRLYATGEYSADRLAALLSGDGLRTRRTPSYPEKPVTGKHLVKLLHNAYYCGVVVHKGVEYPGRHEALIDRETFDTVQAVMQAHNQSGEKQRKHHSYLKGSLFCGKCGSRLGLSNSRGKQGTYYMYWFCLGRTGKCDSRYMQAEVLEDAVERYYANIQLEPARVESVRATLTKAFEQERRDAKKHNSNLKRKHSLLDGERLKLIQAHYAGAVPLDLLKSEQDRIRREMDSITEQIHLTESDFDRIAANLDRALNLAGNVERAYLFATPSVRRLYNQLMFTKLLIEDGDVAGAEFAEPFASLMVHDLVERIRDSATPSTDSDLEDGKSTNPGLVKDRGSNQGTLVELRGIEPLTSSMPWKRSAN